MIFVGKNPVEMLPQGRENIKHVGKAALMSFVVKYFHYLIAGVPVFIAFMLFVTNLAFCLSFAIWLADDGVDKIMMSIRESLQYGKRH